jgi:hypothetical protein
MDEERGVRLLTLHARGRRAGPIAGGLLGVATACWMVAALVQETGMLVAVLGPLAAVSLLGFALGGDDPALERTMPQCWPRWRAAELSVCALAACLALVPTLLQADQHATVALRNLSGLAGLTALGAVALGARLAWLAPTAWAMSGSAFGPRPESWLAPLTWPVQSGDTESAYILPAALAVTGAFLYSRYGPPTTASGAE